MATYKRCDYIDIISTELAKQGGRLTNLSKVSTSKLANICIKYKIDMDALYPAYVEQKKENKRLKQIAKIEKEALQRERMERQIMKMERMKQNERKRTEEHSMKMERIKQNEERLLQHYNNLPQETKDNCVKVLQDAFQQDNEKALAKFANSYEMRKSLLRVILEPFRYEKRFKWFNQDYLNITVEELENNGGQIKTPLLSIQDCRFTKPQLKSYDPNNQHASFDGMFQVRTKTDNAGRWLHLQKPVQEYLWSIKAYKYRKVKGDIKGKIELVV